MTDSKPKKPVRYMDFISRQPEANADPLASRPAPRPAAKPAVKPEKVHSVSDQIPARGAHASASAVVVKKSEAKPLISREPAKSRDLYPEPKPVPKPPVDDLAIKASAALSGTSSPAVKAPDNNAYSLGGKSPFLPNYTIDKRPLSNSVPAKKKDANFEKLSFLGVSDETPSKKNIYEKKSAKSTKESEKPPVKIIDDSGKKRGVPTWLVIIITIILGAAVGAGVYFLLPK